MKIKAPARIILMADAAVLRTDHSKAKVFISYSRRDMALADRLDAALRTRGFEPLIDRTDILAFEEWWKRVEALIGRADTGLCAQSRCGAARERCPKRDCVRCFAEQTLCAHRLSACRGPSRPGRTREAEFHLL